MAEINLCESAKCVRSVGIYALTYCHSSKRIFHLSNAKCDQRPMHDQMHSASDNDSWYWYRDFVFFLPFSTIYYTMRTFVGILYCCPDIYLLHLLINKSRGHFVEKSVCVDKQTKKRENKRICNKSYDFWKSFQTLFLDIYDFVCTSFIFFFFFFFEMWLSTLQTMAEEIVPKRNRKSSETPSRIGKRKLDGEREWG